MHTLDVAGNNAEYRKQDACHHCSLVRVASQLKVCGFLILGGLLSPSHLPSLLSSAGGPLFVCLYVGGPGRGVCVCWGGGEETNPVFTFILPHKLTTVLARKHVRTA